MSLVDLGKRLLHASRLGDVDDVRALMANGAPFTTDWLGTSPLHFASNNGHRGTAEVLLRSGISRDARTKVDRTPLHVAAQEGNLEIVELLLGNGADMEAKDMLKMTPLHWAVERGHTEVVLALVNKGADVNCEDKFDRTAIHIAVANDRIDVISQLQAASSHQQDPVTPLMIASLDDQAQEVTTEVLEAQPIIVGADGLTDGDQSSTSVLATLAALAEATAPLSTATTTSSADALHWLDSQGVATISIDGGRIQNVVSSALEGGQQLTLTQAGKLSLNFVKKQLNSQEVTEEVVIQDSEVEHPMDTVIQDNEDDQRVIAIVTDQDKEGSGDLVVAMTDGKDDEPGAKRLRIDEGEDGIQYIEIQSNFEAMSPEELKRHLEATQKEVKQYKQQFMQKAQEAEGYKRKLTELEKKDNSS